MTTDTIDSLGVEPVAQGSPREDPLRFLFRILTKLYSLWVSLTYPFASRGRKLWIHYPCELSRVKAHRIKLGNSVMLMKDATLDVTAPPEQNGEPIVVIDDNVGLGPCCRISARNYVHLERDIIMAQSVFISDHHCGFEERSVPSAGQGVAEGGRIRIGEGSWIGRGAAIVCTQGELVLGRNCVVAANALVTRSFPSYSVIIGNPAGVIRRFDPVKRKWVIGSVRSTPAAKASE